MGKRPAKRGLKVSKGLVGAVGAAAFGLMAGAAAIFLSKKENRDMVKKNVDSTMRKGKVELVKAEKKILEAKKKILKRK